MLMAAAAALFLSIALTGMVRNSAIAHGVLDVPNARSSHARTTPRGGGLAIVIATMLTLTVLAVVGLLGLKLWAALTGGGLAIAFIGSLDDLRPVSAALRLSVHFAAGLWAIAWLGGLPGLGHFGELLALLGIVWVLNLFNFMDGIDGLAASEAVFIALGAIAPMLLCGAGAEVVAASLVLGGATLGFLVWNWPPARIFMGDVGSGYLGYVIAVLALASAASSPSAVWVWLILGAVFFVDATVTLLRRVARGASPHEPHRTHAYQWLARRWRSHAKVTIAVGLVNVLWLLPCAILAAVRPARLAWMLALALTPLVALAVAAGAGRVE